MSLEAALIETNTLLKQLIAIYTTSQEAVATLGEPGSVEVVEKTIRKRRTRAEIEADNAAAEAAKLVSVKDAVVEGDPEGTRYWVSEEARQVFAQLPGQPDPKDTSFKIESAVHYMVKKAEFAAGNVQQTAAPATEAAAAPAQSTPAASTASSQQPDVSWDDVFASVKALNSAKGADAIRTLIEHFGLKAKTADNPGGATVPSLKELGRNAEVKAAAEALARGESLTAATDDLLG